MRLEDLRYFVAVAEESHVGRAAQRLGVSQPALTKGIQRLEQTLGLTLFDRGPKGMTLTTVGSTFFERARQLCMGLEDAVQEASDMHLGAIGTIRVGVSPPFADGLVAATFAQLLKQRPGAGAKLTVGLNDTLVAALRMGTLDLTVNALDEAQPADLEQLALFRDELCVVARQGHPLLQRARLKFTDLADAGWALPGPEVLARRRLDVRLAECGMPAARVVLQLDSSITLSTSTLRHSDLLGIMSRFSLRSLPGAGLAELPLSEARWSRQIGIVTRRGAYLSPLVVRFMEMLQARSQALAHPGQGPLIPQD